MFLDVRPKAVWCWFFLRQERVQMVGTVFIIQIDVTCS